MIITRTANAGVLIEIEGVKLLIDGVSGEVFPYLETPENIKTRLLDIKPDAFLYTHTHSDHFDLEFVQKYKNLSCGPIFGPQDIDALSVGCLDIKSVPTRHIGKNDVSHVSFVIKGEKTVWFMGDASPSCLKSMDGNPDVIVAPFAYVNTISSLKMTLDTGADHLIVLHLPDAGNDPYGLNSAVFQNIAENDRVTVLDMEQKIIIN